MLADFEFPWLDVCSFINQSMKSVVYEFSVTVMLPCEMKNHSGKTRRSSSSKSTVPNCSMFPAAHFDSPSFKLVRRACLKERIVPSVDPEATKLDLESARPLLSMYDDQKEEQRRKEQEAIRRQLLDAQNALGKVQGGPGSSSSAQIVGHKRPIEAELGLTADDVLELLYENSLLMKSSYIWQSPIGEAESDPTAALMSGLQSNSSIAAAVMAIERHNDLMRTECEPDHVAHDAGAATATATAAFSSASMENGATKAPAPPAEKVPVESRATTISDFAQEIWAAAHDNPFLSVEHIKSQYLQTQADPAASQLQKHFYTDMLQDLTETALFEVAHRISRKPFKRSCRAFDLFSAVMSDVQPEYRGMVKGFLMTDMPFMPGIHRAAKYLRSRGQLVFSSSAISQSSAEAERVLGADALAKSVITDLRKIPSLQQRAMLNSEFDAVIAPSNGTAADKPPALPVETGIKASAATATSEAAGDVCSSEMDDLADAQPRARGGRFGKKSAVPAKKDRLADFKPEGLPADESGSVAMLCLVADFVCGGGFEQAQAAQRKAEAVSRGLHARWQELALRRSESVTALVALKAAEPDDADAGSGIHPQASSADGALGLQTTASRRPRNYRRINRTQGSAQAEEEEPEPAEREVGSEDEEEVLFVTTSSSRARRMPKAAPESPPNELRVYSRSQKDRDKKRRKAQAAVAQVAATKPSKHAAHKAAPKPTAASLKAAGLGHRLLMSFGAETGKGNRGDHSDGSGSDSASLMSMSSDGEQD